MIWGIAKINNSASLCTGKEISNVSTWAYDMSNEELLGAFMNACGRAGLSNSGMCISASAGDDLTEAHYFRGVVLAGLEGVKPPFKPGEKVHSPEKVWPVRPAYSPSIEKGAVFTIERVHYKGKGEGWFLSFEGIWCIDGKPRYPAKFFRKAVPETIGLE